MCIIKHNLQKKKIKKHLHNLDARSAVILLTFLFITVQIFDNRVDKVSCKPLSRVLFFYEFTPSFCGRPRLSDYYFFVNIEIVPFLLC